MSDNEELRNENVILENFYDTVQSNPISYIYRVDSLIGAMSDTAIGDTEIEMLRQLAIVENDRIDDDEIFIDNRKAVNEIFLNSFQTTGFVFSSGEISGLFSIADQCPYEGGVAVFKARALLRSVIDTLFWNDRDICDVSPKIYESSQVQLNSFSVYPNPTSGIFTFKYSFHQTETCLIVLQDVIGQNLKTIWLSNKSGEIDIDLSQFGSGIYSLFLNSSDDLQLIEKVILIKY
ncbi:MAG: T9SS type A sorting domain-containing protein [Chitinophagaceae bacterium]|nr:T9SS type A sorting domain-containing protein [Chitinophagaceae bacterium]